MARRGPDYLFHLVLDAMVDEYAPVVDRIAALPLRSQPGERFEYGFGLDIAGVVVEVVLRILGNPIPAATIVLVALLVVSGLQLLLFAMWFDMESNKELR